jgi:hypothetical protein
MSFDFRHRNFWDGPYFSREELRFLLLRMAATAGCWDTPFDGIEYRG